MKRVLTATALCLALAASAISGPAGAAAAPDIGPVANAAKKKKCGKKGKKSAAGKKGRCKKGGSDIAAATNLFAGSGFSATGCTSTTNCNRSYTYTLAFCRSGTYQARYELNDSITGNTFVDRFGGTWKFSAANAKTGTGTLSYSVDQWQSDAGTAQPTGQQTSQVVAQSATSFLIDGVAFTRSPGAAGC